MDTQETSPSVLLFFHKQESYIFNAGEGLQRLCTEHNIKLSKIDYIFLSRVCSETAAGLPGLLFTLADIERPLSVNVWGPSNLKYLIDAMKSFVPPTIVDMHIFGSSPSSDGAALADLIDPVVLVDNKVVKISAILLKPNFSKGSAVKPGEMSVIYVCELAEILGEFDSENGGAIVLLVDCPTGAHLLELLSMESLSSYYAECSKTVNCIIHLSPNSVTGTPDYQKWMKRFGSAQHIMAGHEMKNTKVSILKSSAKLSTALNYLCPQLFPSPGLLSLQPLNNSSPDKTATEGPVSRVPNSVSAENLLKFTLLPHAHLGLDRTSSPSLVAPSEIMDELLSEIPQIADAAKHVSQIWQEPPETKEAVSYVHENEVMIKEPWLDENILPSCLENVKKDDLEIVLLGTGSCRPSKYRNFSSIYINLFSKGSLLLDCGDGTLGQLKRRYGVKGADSALRNLRCIWISHIHADHHTGLARILSLRHDLLKGESHEPLLVVGPSQLKAFLDAYQSFEDLDMQFINCRYTTESSWVDFEQLNKDPLAQGSTNTNNDLNHKNELHTESSLSDESTAFPLLKSLKEVLSKAGLETLVSVPVVHCQEAFGIVLKAAERINKVGKMIPGWKIVYSGDTRPCNTLTEASRGATILIHEATFEVGMVMDAVAKRHSTTDEAIEVGSGAYRTVLTHLSQRYPKIPVVDDVGMHKTCISFDLMSINLADLPVLPKLLPYFKLLSKDEFDHVPQCH
ncbi:tRNAse Z TRZ4, mitochondrial-like isoform X2 [Mangifera indica]|nr:tRNAse Z TRZ4, mitochondrial-like isoform X2 [Mangifera indica]